MTSTTVVLHNIRSTHNVGAIFRTAEAAGVSKVILTGYTPTPIDRFDRVRKDIAKASLGAEHMLEWEHYKTLEAAVNALRADGFTIVGVEQDKKAVPYTKYTPTEKVAIVFGNEVRGLSPKARALCDTLIEIPMHGRKESLNVSVAAGIVLFRLMG